MDPLLILLCGMAIVIGGILLLRLHAFLALMAGALVVASLTSSEGLFRRRVQEHGEPIARVNLEDKTFQFADPDQMSIVPGRCHIVRGLSDDTEVSAVEAGTTVDIQRVGDTAWTYRATDSTADNSQPLLESGDWLISDADFQVADALRRETWTERIAEGFGTMCGKIGILIALAAVIGRGLLDSGAANRIVQAMRAACGERQTPLALVFSGFVIGIPVYFDTVFYLLLPLARALGKQTGRNYLLYILSIIVGATMAHSLVPPTPGPLLVASELSVPLGQMILAGSFVGLIAASAGFLFALLANRRLEIALPEDRSAGLTDADGVADDSTSSEWQEHRPLPPLGLALLPIVLPVLLLSIGTYLNVDGTAPSSMIGRVFNVLSDKNMALGIAAVIALGMLVRYQDRRTHWSLAIQETMLSAGNIVLITAAGGAFGHVLRQSGIAEAIQQRFPLAESGLGLLVVAFAITAVVRIAQGSATVAMITSVGIVAPLVQPATLAFPPVFVALAIGCGSKPLPWMNDSGFWVITRMSGMTESQSLRTFSVALTIMGLVGLLVTLAGAAMFAQWDASSLPTTSSG